MRIIDSHVHFEVKGERLSAGYREKFGEEKWRRLQQLSAPQRARWRRAWSFPDPLPPADDVRVTADRWLSEMDANNISHMIFVTGGGNDTLSGIVGIAPDRFIGYAHHDPALPDAADRLETALSRQGLSGYKIIGPATDIPLDDPSLTPLWQVAERHGLPVLIHFGILGGPGGVARHANMSPMVIHDVAKAHPEIPFIIPHFGCGEVKDTLFLAWACPNIHVDSSGSNQWTRFMPYPLTVRDLFRKYYETLGPERILFGTDSMWFPRGFVRQYYEQQMRDCVELGMPEADIRLIFSGNARRLHRLPEDPAPEKKEDRRVPAG